MDLELTVHDLSPDQRLVFDEAVSWTEGGRFNGDLLTVGGLAGTGKTTVLGVFAANTSLRVAYVTYTGRAASVLGRKLQAAGAAVTDKLCAEELGWVPANDNGLYDLSLTRQSDVGFVGTIHRLLYKPIIDNATGELRGFVKRSRLDRDYQLIVIDEASMVGETVLSDIQAHGIPILAVGDHGQLPPVKDKGGLMADPDFRLERIHRQAQGNPIIELAHRVRTTGRLDGFEDGDRIRFGATTHFQEAYATAIHSAGGPLQVGALCWRNASRIQLNQAARKALGFRGVPGPGEVVMCLRNSPPIYNGMRGRLTAQGERGTEAWILRMWAEFPEEGLPPRRIDACAAQFNRERTYSTVAEFVERGITVNAVKEAGDLYDFGYCLTVHKSQGSQFEHAIVYLDRPMNYHDEEWRRWAYTAVTRASERLTILQ